MPTVVGMNGRGRLTLPAETRRQLGIEGEAQFQVEVRDGKAVLQPMVLVPQEDAWAYTPEHRALVKRALQEVREGRTVRMGPDDLERLAAETDRAQAESSPAAER